MGGCATPLDTLVGSGDFSRSGGEVKARARSFRQEEWGENV